MKQKSGVLGAGVLGLWIFLFLVWLGATATFEIAPVLCGLGLTGVTAYFSATRTEFWSGLDLRFARIVAGCGYLLVFLRDMVLSNISVLRYVYAPEVRTAPETITVPLRISGPRERLALMNTIALTPGTLPLDLVGDHVQIHVLDKKLSDGVPAGVRTFEIYLEKAIG